MIPADDCAMCGKALDETNVQLQHDNDRTFFCSLECVVRYAVAQIRQRLEIRNRQARLFARQQRKLHSARHAKRHRSTVA